MWQWQILKGCIELSDAVFFPDDEFISPDTVGLSIPDKVVKLKGTLKNSCFSRPVRI